MRSALTPGTGSSRRSPIRSATCPGTPRPTVPPEARALLFRPLELARAGGKPLAQRDITLVLQTVADEPPRPAPARERLRDALDEADGWDIVHVSGHGAPGELLLETAAGRPDRVTATDLAGLLEPARQHLRLVTVSACWSAGVTADAQRRLPGLPPSQDRSSERIVTGSPSPGALATELTERLGCSVLAMRFPVDDEFAIALCRELYRLLAEKGQPLSRAVGITLRRLGQDRHLALSVAAPALFGRAAEDVTLAAPPRRRAGPPATTTTPGH